MKRKLFLVDDHPLVREWLANLIKQQPDLVICGEAGTAAEALDQVGRLQPDIVITDISLAQGSGLDLIKDLKTTCPGVAVIVLSMHEESLYAERALRAGARGYVMKKESTQNIVTAIRRVIEGKIYVSDRFSSAMAEKLAEGKGDTASPIEKLSDRELEVFRMIGQGLETRQIAESLHISMKTVQAYCARIKEKYNLANATELLREAIRWHEAESKY